jgi:hypothetical protein
MLMSKRLLGCFAAGAVLLLALSLTIVGQEQSQSLTGWISDSSCAAKGTVAAHKDCAIKCVKEKGAKWVFVNTPDKKVLAIENQDAVNQEKDLGQEVKVSGHVTKDGSLHVDTIGPAS